MYKIYKLTSPSGKSYIGLTKRDFKIRLSEHFGRFTEKDKKKAITNAIIKYPDRNDWDISVLCECENIDQANIKEKYYIDYYKSFGKGYNMTGGGDGFDGLIVTEKHKKAISDGRKEYFNTPEGQEWKEKLSAMYMGNEFGKGNIPWNKGIKDWMSDEIKEKSSIAVKEYWKDNIEAKEKVSERTKKAWQEGKFDNRPPLSPESREKGRLKVLGFKQSDYQKQRAREAATATTKSACIHCGLLGGGGGFRRWHNENCMYQYSLEEQEIIKESRKVGRVIPRKKKNLPIL